MKDKGKSYPNVRPFSKRRTRLTRCHFYLSRREHNTTSPQQAATASNLRRIKQTPHQTVTATCSSRIIGLKIMSSNSTPRRDNRATHTTRAPSVDSIQEQDLRMVTTEETESSILTGDESSLNSLETLEFEMVGTEQNTCAGNKYQQVSCAMSHQ